MTIRPFFAGLIILVTLPWGALLWSEGPRVRRFRTRASWYGYREAGCRTASGEILDPSLPTAASRTLPLGTHAIVTNLKNGLQVAVTVTDKGPYIKGRGIDLSHAAAFAIDMLTDGVVPVEVEVQR